MIPYKQQNTLHIDTSIPTSTGEEHTLAFSMRRQTIEATSAELPPILFKTWGSGWMGSGLELISLLPSFDYNGCFWFESHLKGRLVPGRHIAVVCSVRLITIAAFYASQCEWRASTCQSTASTVRRPLYWEVLCYWSPILVARLFTFQNLMEPPSTPSTFYFFLLQLRVAIYVHVGFQNIKILFAPDPKSMPTGH